LPSRLPGDVTAGELQAKLPAFFAPNFAEIWQRKNGKSYAQIPCE
jgi:hypothetical protein